MVELVDYQAAYTVCLPLGAGQVVCIFFSLNKNKLPAVAADVSSETLCGTQHCAESRRFVTLSNSCHIWSCA